MNSPTRLAVSFLDIVCSKHSQTVAYPLTKLMFWSRMFQVTEFIISLLLHLSIYAYVLIAW